MDGTKRYTGGEVELGSTHESDTDVLNSFDAAARSSEAVAESQQSSKPPLLRQRTLAEDAHDFLMKAGPVVGSYLYGTIATLIKTFAWWFNQWPFIYSWPFMAKWAISAGMAGFEYMPLTKAMGTASAHNVHLGLLTAYMEFADNTLRMLQQVFLGDPLAWFDWTAAAGLGLCVAFQGGMHYSRDKKLQAAPPPVDDSNDIEVHEARIRKSRRERITLLSIIAICTSIGSLIGGLAGGAFGQAYVLATLATAAKTFAWWINQYPQLKGASFLKKWLCGWGIAACIEYFPLIGAFTIASENGVHLGLMTAYMEALDNFFRICQQKLLEKPLAWYDLLAAAGMFVFVMFQGIMRYAVDHG